jgi:YGGT family.
MLAVIAVLEIVLGLYRWILLAMVILSWLISFGVVNTRNQFVSVVWQVINQLTEPLLRPIRRFMPSFSGLDLSPIVLFLAIIFLEVLLASYIRPAVIRAGI